MIRQLKTKDKFNFTHYAVEKGCTFNPETTFNDVLKRGDSCFIWEEGNTIKGFVLITGVASKAPNKEILFVTDSNKVTNKLFKIFTILMWTGCTNGFLRVKRSDKIYDMAVRHKFSVVSRKDNDIILKPEVKVHARH